LGVIKAVTKGRTMTFEELYSLFLTNPSNENKCRTSRTIKGNKPADHRSYEGGSYLYISNCPPADPPDEKLLIAHEVREMLLYILEQGEQATHDEISYVIYMMTCLIGEIEGDAAFNT